MVRTTLIRLRCWISLCALCVLCGEGYSASPLLNGIAPRGAQRGTDAIFLFNGGRLSDAQELLFYSPGLTTTKLEVVNDGQVKAAVKIAPNCQLGEHAVRLRTATGVSELRTFYVGALPVVDEKEPNSDFAAPQKIPLNVTVQGVIDNEDVDYFAVECKKGQRLSVEIEGMRLGGALFDPYIAILDSKRFELAACDDTPMLHQDAACGIVVPADGTYVIQVRESAYGGNGACSYRLHVGTFPRPLAVVPAGGKCGEEIEVTFIGDPTGPFKQKVKLPATPDAKFGLFAQDAGGVSPSPVPFRVSEFGNVIEADGNSTPQTGTLVPQLPTALNGVISKPGEVDYYRFKAKKGQAFDVHCFARRLGSPLDSVMTLGVVGGGALAANDDAVGPDSYFRFTFPEDKEYYLGIADHLHQGGPTYFYRVEFLPIEPRAVVTIPSPVQYSQERHALAIPRGNRMATLVNVARSDFGGEVTIGADSLPAGVVMSAENMAANLDTVPVVLEAAPTASVGGKLTALTARHADPAQKIQSRFNLNADLIIGNPGQSVYWRVEADRTAVAVTDEAPFKITIVEPKAPLVQNGSMNLKITAERKPGFTAPITIVPLFNPPGVGSASSVVIPEKQNEVLLPINAAGNAQVRKWKTAVLGTATVGNGPVWVSSQLATLEVAPPYVAFTMERAASEQGKPTDIFCKIQVNTPFTGSAKVKLLGLPPKVTTPDLEITKDSKELAFKLVIDKTSPPGQHKNIFCQVVAMKDGEPVVQSAGGTELRIDVPLPPKVNAPPKPTPTPAATKPAETPKAPEKRLTRLEQLRKEQEEREKGTPTPGDPPKK
jgi:hypothetical protein